jgi:glyoxylase-like metal-dependent hydrolase (beta-lactamase superfamily II)
LIDPGDDAETIVQMVEQAGVHVKYLLHTHAHFDHILATGPVQKRLGGTTCLHGGDLDLWNNLPLQGRFFGMELKAAPTPEKMLQDEEELEFGTSKLRVLHTPGHSPGGVCYQLVGGEESVFSGDTLFHQSVGRSDLWGGDHRVLLRSIKERLLVLHSEIQVHPGHGPSTTIGFEKRHNPFLQ